MKPRYYLALNRDTHLTFWAPPTIAACVLALLKHQEDVDDCRDGHAAGPDPGCMNVLVAHDSTITFLHADRFLDGVAHGDITEEASAQGG